MIEGGRKPHRTGQFVFLDGRESTPTVAESRVLEFFPDRVETLRDMERDFPEPSEPAPLSLSRAIRAHYVGRMFAQVSVLADQLLSWHGPDLPSWQYGAAARCILQQDPETRIGEHEEIVRFCSDVDSHVPLVEEPTPEQLSRRLAMARFNLADEYEEAGRIAEAAAEFERSLEGVEEPEMRIARLARIGCLYAKLGDFTAARERFRLSEETDAELHAKRVERLRPYYPDIDLATLSPNFQ